MNTKVDLRKALTKLNIDESQITDIGLGKVTSDDNGNVVSKSNSPKLDSFILSWEQFDKLYKSDTDIYVIYKDSNNLVYKYLTVNDIADSNDIPFDLCEVCGEGNFCLMVYGSDYSSLYQDVLGDSLCYVCYGCHNDLLNDEVEICSLCHQAFVHDDGYCSDCY